MEPCWLVRLQAKTHVVASLVLLRMLAGIFSAVAWEVHSTRSIMCQFKMELLACLHESLIQSKQQSYCQWPKPMSVTVWPGIFVIREIKYYYCVVKSQCVITSDESMDHVDAFIEQFKKKGVSFCCLYHHEEEDGRGAGEGPVDQ
jgi:hypothetical protein